MGSMGYVDARNDVTAVLIYDSPGGSIAMGGYSGLRQADGLKLARSNRGGIARQSKTGENINVPERTLLTEFFDTTTRQK